MTGRPTPPPEIAYYYPEPYWLMREGGWVKTLLLFFDEVAILLPQYMRHRSVMADPVLAGPLEDQGLLKILEPEWFVDEVMATQVTEIVDRLVDSGAFDSIPEREPFAELSMSRMGYSAAEDLAWMVYQKLAQRGLARESTDGVSIPMHWRVRSAFLLLLAQLAREAGQRHQLDLHPVSNGRGVLSALVSLLDLEPMPSRGKVVQLDLEVVSLNLDDVPLDEVLDFRQRYRDEHHKYMHDLRTFVLSLSMLEDADRERALVLRRAELQERAQELRGRALQAWKKPKRVAGFGLGIAGAAWSLITADLVPAALGAIGAALGMLPNEAAGNAYSYLFDAQRELG